MSEPKLTKADQKILAKLDAVVEQWAVEVGWRGQLDMIASMSTGFAGPRRINGSGGAELKMLILRQRSLIDRWVRQAYLEGIAAGTGNKYSEKGRAALSHMEVKR